MDFQFADPLKRFRKETREFVEAEVCPCANSNDRNEVMPMELIKKMADQGYLGASIATKYGGKGWDQLQCGILVEEIGKGCSSARSLITSHLGLVTETIDRCATNLQKQYWLPILATGQKLGAFCLTEQDAGSDAKSIKGLYLDDVDGYVINCRKKWITFGQLADVFLVFARNDQNEVSAFLIDRDTPGIEVRPVTGMLGLKAAMIANIDFTEVKVPKERMLGAKGFGLLQVMSTALDNGRYSVALGSLGIAKAALKESVEFSHARKQFNSYLKDHQLTKRKITDMYTKVKTASLLCYHVGALRNARHPDALIQSCMAKYYTTTIAAEITKEAVQIQGAYGCSCNSPVERYFRDAKIMEIIEGTSEIQQIIIADYFLTNRETITDY